MARGSSEICITMDAFDSQMSLRFNTKNVETFTVNQTEFVTYFGGGVATQKNFGVDTQKKPCIAINTFVVSDATEVSCVALQLFALRIAVRSGSDLRPRRSGRSRGFCFRNEMPRTWLHPSPLSSSGLFHTGCVRRASQCHVTRDSCRDAAPIDLCRYAIPIDSCRDASPIDLCRDAAPFDLYKDAAPIDLYRDAALIDLYRDAALIDLYRDATSIDLYRGAAPFDLCRDAAPIDLCRDAAPIDLCREAAPIDLCREAAPIDLCRDAALIDLHGDAKHRNQCEAGLPFQAVKLYRANLRFCKVKTTTPNP